MGWRAEGQPGASRHEVPRRARRGQENSQEQAGTRYREQRTGDAKAQARGKQSQQKQVVTGRGKQVQRKQWLKQEKYRHSLISH